MVLKALSNLSVHLNKNNTYVQENMDISCNRILKKFYTVFLYSTQCYQSNLKWNNYNSLK